MELLVVDHNRLPHRRVEVRLPLRLVVGVRGNPKERWLLQGRVQEPSIRRLPTRHSSLVPVVGIVEEITSKEIVPIGINLVVETVELHRGRTCEGPLFSSSS